MLAVIGLDSLEDLFSPIPEQVRLRTPVDVPVEHCEQDIAAVLGRLAGRNRNLDELVCFLGAGVYDHYVPAVVWHLAGRGEFATSYTPYQPEMSQGVLQGLFEYQTLISELTGLEISNASLYDGASAVAEAVTMAVGATGRTRVVVSELLDPRVRDLLVTSLRGLDLEFVTASVQGGQTDPEALRHVVAGAAAVVVAQPNLVGVIEDVAALGALAHDAGARLIVRFDPIAAGVLEPPGHLGADIVVGEGQALGNHPTFGGPAFGFLACGAQDVRRLPGRLVGETVDVDGTRGFVLTLQAREQHIRRERATSNICTNQTLNALAAAVYLTWLGPEGLEELAQRCLAGAHYAAERLAALPGVQLAYPNASYFKEFVVRLPVDPLLAAERLAERGYLAGLPLTGLVPDLEDGLLIAVTERRTRAEIDAFVAIFAQVLAEGRASNGAPSERSDSLGGGSTSDGGGGGAGDGGNAPSGHPLLGQAPSGQVHA